MDLQILREEAKKFQKKAQKVGEKVLSASTDKLVESKYTLSSVSELDACVKKSEETLGTDSKTGKEKKFSHRVVIIFADTKSDYFKSFLYKLPVLITKAYSQWVVCRVADNSMKDLDKKKHKISWEISMVVYENKKVIKVLEGIDNVQKVVKSPSLDINTTIDNL